MNEFALKLLTAQAEKIHLFFLGQAGYVIRSSSGQFLAVDLYLSDCVERIEGHIGFKRLLPKILSPFDVAFDCIVTTHPHMDHFDMDVIPELMYSSHSKLFASVDCRKMIQKLEMTDDRVIYVKPGEQYQAGDFKLSFVNCDHGTGAPDAVGLIIEVDEKRIYYVGDTCLRLDWVEELRTFGEIDVMIAPINGAYGNLNEKECAELSQALKPKMTIPCHYGMFASHGGDPGKFLDIMKERCPGNQILLMAQGEQVTL